MSNDDCSALCPLCGHPTKVGTFPDSKGIITSHSVYCSNPSCGWDENWIKDKEFGGFIKQ